MSFRDRKRQRQTHKERDRDRKRYINTETDGDKETRDRKRALEPILNKIPLFSKAFSLLSSFLIFIVTLRDKQGTDYQCVWQV